MRTTYYPIKVEGKQRTLSWEEAMAIGTEEVMDQLRKIKEMKADKRRVKDGFQPGFQENINTYCGSRKEYDRALRDRGLIEVGYGFTPTDPTVTSNPFNNDDVIKTALDIGIDLSEREVDALKSGELLKDTECVASED